MADTWFRWTRHLASPSRCKHRLLNVGHIIATMVLDAGKAASEGDVEVSEAIDFANYYADRFSDPAFFDGSDFTPLGTVVIAPPWNFPFAIPCGGVLAALMAGNTVILKPASATALTGWVLAKCLWDAGIPREVLQFITCAGSRWAASFSLMIARVRLF
jgi:RHH-type transcriptional regulator, proline utilization regulon repressor / proline dehydrogenase / delta 1-pyrroline-5-carboxylate dehydrogenase